MKKFLTKYFGILGVVLYYIYAVIARIPVFVFLTISVVTVLLIWNPFLKRDDSSPRWMNNLYDWYCGN
jgi:hypothetical protein